MIEAREDEIATLKQQIAELKKNAGSGEAGGDDAAVDAIKGLPLRSR